jgi:hypothetical protein
MDALTQELMNRLGPRGLTKVSKQIGADRQTTASALSTIAPLLVSALANNAADPNGVQSLQQALVEDHDGSILQNISGFLSNPQAANGSGILEHILGAQQPVVAQGVAENVGLQSSQVSQLMQIAAPLLMGALGQQQHQQGLDANSLASFLGGQQQAVQQSNPNLLGLLNTMLDSNRNGSALDEVLGVMGKLLSGRR